MNSEIFLHLAQIGTILIGLTVVAVTLRSHRRQLHAQMFVEFSSRLHQVLRTLPTHTWTMKGDHCGPVLHAAKT